MTSELVLERVFLSLAARAFPLTVRDYTDALEALRAGHGGLTRSSLLRMCQTLWARDEEQMRAIDMLFRSLEPPTEAQVQRLLHPETSGAPLPSSRPVDDPTQPRRSIEPAEPTDTGSPAMELAPADQPGIGLPAAPRYQPSLEYFVFNAHPQIPLRSLIIAWRRYRLPARTGPKVVLDVDATVREQYRNGRLLSPVFAARRLNQASLVVLIDCSRSMAPWASMNSMWVESLRESRLARWSVFYFDNVPGERLYRTESLHDPVDLDRLLDETGGVPALIVSDAGAARGRRDRDRIAAVRQFLRRTRNRWTPVAWLNPMPRHRWRSTSAERIDRMAGVSMSVLDEDGLTRAVDVLRGKVTTN